MFCDCFLAFQPLIVFRCSARGNCKQTNQVANEFLPVHKALHLRGRTREAYSASREPFNLEEEERKRNALFAVKHSTLTF